MNMPIDEKRQVRFTTTLFALIRESLGIKMRSGKYFCAVLSKEFTKLNFSC